ncbi:MAG TPA: HAD family hydrolase [Rhodocyclaceae bacterium]
MAVDARKGAPRAVFVDKDGTLVRDVPDNVDPARIELMPGAAPALAELRGAGYAIVLVSNQGGVARGAFSEDELEAVWQRLAELLAPHGVALDAVYYCPHDPAGSDPRYAVACRCRKPQPGLIWRAAADHGYELARSWLVGDILDDIEAGNRAGCRTILLDVGGETEWLPGPWRRPTCVVHSFGEAAQHILFPREGRRAGIRRFRSPPWMLPEA